MKSLLHFFALNFLLGFVLNPAAGDDPQPRLPDSEYLTEQVDFADQMLQGIDRFLLQEIASAAERRNQAWSDELKTVNLFHHSDSDSSGIPVSIWLETKRKLLALTLGIRDEREPFTAVQILQTTVDSGIVARGSTPSRRWQAVRVRWPVFKGVHGEGLLIEPIQASALANAIVLPDADQSPEQIAGFSEELPSSLQYARILANRGYRVLIPSLISRQIALRGPPGEPGRVELTNREFVYRPAFILGRHIIGYEIQKVLAAVDWLKNQPAQREIHPVPATAEPLEKDALPLSIVGYGEGGLIALSCAALDDRIDDAYIAGAFGPRESMWQEPVCRNLFGFVRDFGDAELAAMIFPRSIIIDFEPGPSLTLATRGGAPGTLRPPTREEASQEFLRAANLLSLHLEPTSAVQDEVLGAILEYTSPSEGTGSGGYARWITARQEALPGRVLQTSNPTHPLLAEMSAPMESEIELLTTAEGGTSEQMQLTELIDHTQVKLAESSKIRQQFMSRLDTSSLESYRNSIQEYRSIFYDQVIGRFDNELSEINPRSRRSWETEEWIGYEVVLDVWPGVIAYGALLIPKDIEEGERRPVVVCQHGLEGRPTDVFLGDHPAYHDFAAKLCERGYVVFAPQNLYLLGDRFRTLQRKANSIGRTLFSVMVPQHQQILRWLKTLPYVDSSRIAFYGLSYGGKSAMRIPAILEDYCLSICSADFNEWIVKNASTADRFSYVWTGEYEIFEYNLGNTFGYAEMASLICPRPFMVERGHFDGVAEDQWVGHEYAKVLHLYQARLGIGHHTEIEWFAGPHTIHGKRTFEFLDQHLRHEPH